jgi:starch synthase
VSRKKLNILLVSAEVSPFAKVGGLADVAGALPKALKAMGHDVRVVMPGYKMVESNKAYNVKEVCGRLNVPLGWRNIECSIKQTTIGQNIPVYLICAPYFVNSVDSKSIYVPGSEPYAFFGKAVLDMLRAMQPAWRPDVIHCNDWHTGFLPVYRYVYYQDDPVVGSAACVFTIHNLAYQGEFEPSILPDYGLPESLYTMDKLECYGKVNFLKAGIVFSDMVSTVSPTYCQEIQTPAYGCRLDGLLSYINELGRLRGILNGIDYEEFNPATDKHIRYHYSLENPTGKAKNKQELQKLMGLPVNPEIPLVGLISRLADQKGLDLIKAIMPKLMKKDCQFVLLGTGDPAYEKYFASLEKKYPKQVKTNIGFDAVLAQMIYAGSDMFLMPSQFEPCGLGQLISLRYGTIPIVRKTGGLADTIVDYSPDNPESNGFVFVDYKPSAFWKAIERALDVFAQKNEWNRLVRTALSSDFSWSASAGKYEEFYREAIDLRRSSATCVKAA